MRVIFVHGWGFGPDFWNGVRNDLTFPSECINLGFCGPNTYPLGTDGETVFIGHSLGFMWALEDIYEPPKALIAINGFTRFTSTLLFPGVVPRVLKRMRKAFETEPEAVLYDFLERCGTSWRPEWHDDPMLAEGLRWLAEWDKREAYRALACPTLALAGLNDPIVTPEATDANFKGFASDILWADGGHLLPLTHPEWCADQIDAFLESLL